MNRSDSDMLDLAHEDSFAPESAQMIRVFANDIYGMLTNFLKNNPDVRPDSGYGNDLLTIKRLTELISSTSKDGEAIQLARTLVGTWKHFPVDKNQTRVVLPELLECIFEIDKILGEEQNKFDEKKRQQLALENRNLIKTLTDFKVKVSEERVGWEQDLSTLRSEISSLKDRAGEAITVAKNMIDEGAEYVEKRKVQVDAEVGAITTGVLSAQFANAAKEEKKTANFYRIFAFSSMGITIVFALVALTLPYILRYDVSLNLAILKILVLILMSAFSGYAAKESSRHREYHLQFLQTALDLQSIEPFLAPLDKQVKEKIMTDLALKIFAYRRTNVRTETGAPSALSDSFIRLVEKLISK